MNSTLTISSPSLTHIRSMCLGKTKFPSAEIAWYVLDYNQRHQIRNSIPIHFCWKPTGAPIVVSIIWEREKRSNRYPFLKKNSGVPILSVPCLKRVVGLKRV